MDFFLLEQGLTVYKYDSVLHTRWFTSGYLEDRLLPFLNFNCRILERELRYIPLEEFPETHTISRD